MNDLDLIRRSDALNDVQEILESYKQRKRYEQVGALTAVIAGLKQLPVAQPELWEVDNMVIDCNKCIWATRDGNCVTWDCKFVDKQEAYDAWLKRRVKDEIGTGGQTEDNGVANE